MAVCYGYYCVFGLAFGFPPVATVPPLRPRRRHCRRRPPAGPHSPPANALLLEPRCAAVATAAETAAASLTPASQDTCARRLTHVAVQPPLPPPPPAGPPSPPATAPHPEPRCAAVATADASASATARARAAITKVALASPRSQIGGSAQPRRRG